MKFSRITSSLLAGAGAAGLLVAMTGSAAAHVTVQPPEGEVGAYAKLTFRVPNESEDAGTVKLSVSFPEDPPFGSARVKPRPGWTAKIETEGLPEPVELGHGEVTEAVRTITWTATEGTLIGPDEFDEFEVSVGPLPDVEELAFPAIQTYDDGETVAWDEVVEPGADEPERPAPTLTLVPGAADGHGEPDVAAAQVSAGSDQRAETAAAAATDGTARALGTAGLIVGFLGLVVGGLGIGLACRGGPSES